MSLGFGEITCVKCLFLIMSQPPVLGLACLEHLAQFQKKVCPLAPARKRVEDHNAKLFPRVCTSGIGEPPISPSGESWGNQEHKSY